MGSEPEVVKALWVELELSLELPLEVDPEPDLSTLGASSAAGMARRQVFCVGLMALRCRMPGLLARVARGSSSVGWALGPALSPASAVFFSLLLA